MAGHVLAKIGNTHLMDNYIRSSIGADVDFLTDNLRKEDIEEVQAGGLTPFGALFQGYAISDPCWTLLDDGGSPIAMVGVCSSPNPSLGLVWLLGTRGIEDFSYKFAKYSKPALERLFEETGYDGLYNYTHAHNELHHRWLRWLGFKFLRKIDLPPNNQPFYEFVKLRG
jgi:hypothetical protein